MAEREGEIYNSTTQSCLLCNTSTRNTSTESTDLFLTFSICGNISALISLVGVIGNALNTAVLVGIIKRNKTSQTPVYHLLLAMGIADMMSLLCVFIYCVTMFTRWPPLLWQVCISFPFVL